MGSLGASRQGSKGLQPYFGHLRRQWNDLRRGPDQIRDRPAGLEQIENLSTKLGWISPRYVSSMSERPEEATNRAPSKPGSIKLSIKPTA